MGYKIDLTGVELRSFEPVPEGRYRAEVSDLVYSPSSKRSGLPKMQLTFNLLGPTNEATTKALETAGPNGAVLDVAVAKRKAFLEFSLGDTSKWNVKRILAALGDDPADLEGEIEIEKEDYIGRECVLVLGIEDYQGTPKQRTRRVEPLVATPAPAPAKRK